MVRLAEDPQTLMAAVEELAPDAVLTDIRMPPTYTPEGIIAQVVAHGGDSRYQHHRQVPKGEQQQRE